MKNKAAADAAEDTHGIGMQIGKETVRIPILCIFCGPVDVNLFKDVKF
ncbi:hypothetical protein [Clostridium sp. chh4-2]|nr:hypothetical protein [Clostridium sp. chh4-2]